MSNHESWLEIPYSQNQFLGWEFLAASYSKTALVVTNITCIFYSAAAATYLFFLFNLGNGTAILELLLKAGADLNAVTAWGDTAAHYAALTGKTAAKPFSSRITILIPPWFHEIFFEDLNFTLVTLKCIKEKTCEIVSVWKFSNVTLKEFCLIVERNFGEFAIPRWSGNICYEQQDFTSGRMEVITKVWNTRGAYIAQLGQNISESHFNSFTGWYRVSHIEISESKWLWGVEGSMILLIFL